MRRLATTLAALFCLVSDMVWAAPVLIVGSDGKLQGATGVEVRGRLYNVEFKTGSCIEAFGGCDGTTFIFRNEQLAQLASQALMDTVLVDGPAGTFDTVPRNVAGCGVPGVLTACFVWTPYQVVDDFLQLAKVVDFFYAQNTEGEGRDEVIAAGGLVRLRPEIPIFEPNVWAVWRRDPSQVPEPAGVVWLALAISAIATRRVRSRAHSAR